jgi:two-component system, cell cycle sensor histidine kinase and response regulator CckA
MSSPSNPSGELFNALVANSADAVVLLNEVGEIVFISESSRRLLGYTLEERLGHSGWDMVHADDQPAVRAAFKECLRKPRMAITAEFRNRHKDGTWRYIEAVAVNRLDEPAVSAIVVNYRDITTRHHAEEGLRSSEERLRHIVEHAQDLIYYCDPSGRFTYVNPAAARVMKYSEDELLGRHFLTLIRPDYRQEASNVYSAQMANRTPNTYFEFPSVTRDGETVWIGQHVQIVYHAGVIVAVHAIARDITRQKEAEERLRASEGKYRSLIEHAAFGIYTSTEDGRILEANPAMARMLGYGSPAELMTANMVDFYQSPADRQALIARNRHQPGGSDELRWKRKDGHPILVRLTTIKTEVQPGELERYETIAEDVTDRRALEDQLRQAQKMEAVGRLARGIAHDFNNILAAIVGASELLVAQCPEGHPSRIEAAEIRKAAERGAALTRQLLAFSRPRALEPQVFDAYAQIAGIETTLRRIVGGGVALTLRAIGEPPYVKADPGQLEQVLMNLVVNARDAMPDGGTLEIRVDSFDVSEHNAARYPGLPIYRFARIAVQDSGVGMDAELRSHVFEPFFTTKEASKGTGLGLSIVYSIAKEAGGTVTCTSAPGRGATFEVLLPAVSQPPRANPQPPISIP